MTGRPPKKDPRVRSRVATLPPAARSRAALGLDAAAAEGRFALQVCRDCGATQWPPRDACGGCLSVALDWRDAPRGGAVLAVATVHVSPEPYFRERGAWRVGLVRLDAGPSVMVHLHPEADRDARVRLSLRLDKAGRGVMVAEPEIAATEDMRMRDFAADPRGRRVLVVDALGPAGPALCRAFREAGAATVFAGVAETWTRPAALGALDGAQTVPLDVTDELSLREAAASIGGKVDILIYNAGQARPGDILGRPGLVEARREIETHYLGLLRCAQAFGGAMRARGADGAANAAAWVTLLPVGAVAPEAGWSASSAAAAAALSATLALRAEMRPGGVRVCAAFVGPLDEPWRAEAPPPKLAPATVARAVVAMLREGREEAWIGDVAAETRARRAPDPALHDREALEAFRP